MIITDSMGTINQTDDEKKKKEVAKIMVNKINGMRDILQGMDGADIFTVIRISFKGQEDLLVDLSQAFVKTLKDSPNIERQLKAH